MPPKTRRPARKGKNRKELPIGTRQCRVPFDPPKINVVTTQRIWIRMQYDGTETKNPFSQPNVSQFLPTGTIAYRFMRTRAWSNQPIFKILDIQPDLASFMDTGTEIHYPKIAWEWGRAVSERWFPNKEIKEAPLANIWHGGGVSDVNDTVDHLLTIKIQINHELPPPYKTKRMEEKIRSDLATIELTAALLGKGRREEEERRLRWDSFLNSDSESECEPEGTPPPSPPPGKITHADWQRRICFCTQRGEPDCEFYEFPLDERPCWVKQPKKLTKRQEEKKKTKAHLRAEIENVKAASRMEAKRIVDAEIEEMRKRRLLPKREPPRPLEQEPIPIFAPKGYDNGWRPRSPDNHTEITHL